MHYPVYIAIHSLSSQHFLPHAATPLLLPFTVMALTCLQVIFGGRNNFGYFNDVWAWRINTGTWEQWSAEDEVAPIGRDHFGAVYDAGHVYIFGACGCLLHVHAAIAVSYITSGRCTFYQVGLASIGRDHSEAIYDAGHVYIFGAFRSFLHVVCMQPLLVQKMKLLQLAGTILVLCTLLAMCTSLMCPDCSYT